jgi:PspAA-like protein
MIVRVSGEGQYRLEGADGELSELDNAVVAAVQAGDESAYRSSYDALLQFVRASGSSLAEDELVGSDFILPPPDLSLKEAEREFQGEGLIPD